MPLGCARHRRRPRRRISRVISSKRGDENAEIFLRDACDLPSSLSLSLSLLKICPRLYFRRDFIGAKTRARNGCGTLQRRKVLTF